MSAPVTHRVVEWSPTEAVGFDAATKQYTRAANFAELSSKIGGGTVVVAVSRRSTFIKALRVPNASVSEVNLILRTQMAQMFPVPLHELAYSFRLTDDVNADGRLAIVAAMRESDLVRLHSEAKESGFRVDRVIPTVFGAMLLAESLDIKNAAVVQETAEGLGIDLLWDGEVRYSRVAPMPANPDLISAEISRTFQAVGLDGAPAIAAGGFPYAEAAKKTNATTLEFLPQPLERLGIRLETKEAIEKRERAAQSNRTRLAALLCASAALLAMLVYVEHSEEAEKVRASNARWNRTLTEKRNIAKRLEEDISKLNATSDILKRALSPAQYPGDVYTTLSNYTPAGLWLTGTTYERGKLMYIRGTAANSDAVAAYLQALTTEPRFRDVKLVFANNGEIEKTPVVQFSIQAFPVGNVPLVEIKRKGSR